MLETKNEKNTNSKNPWFKDGCENGRKESYDESQFVLFTLNMSTMIRLGHCSWIYYFVWLTNPLWLGFILFILLEKNEKIVEYKIANRTFRIEKLCQIYSSLSYVAYFLHFSLLETKSRVIFETNIFFTLDINNLLEPLLTFSIKKKKITRKQKMKMWSFQDTDLILYPQITVSNIV